MSNLSCKRKVPVFHTPGMYVSLARKLHFVALSSYNYNTIKTQVTKRIDFHIQTFNTVNKEQIKYYDTDISGTSWVSQSTVSVQSPDHGYTPLIGSVVTELNFCLSSPTESVT